MKLKAKSKNQVESFKCLFKDLRKGDFFSLKKETYMKVIYEKQFIAVSTKTGQAFLIEGDCEIETVKGRFIEQ